MNGEHHTLGARIEKIAEHIAETTRGASRRDVKGALCNMGFYDWLRDFRFDLVVEAVREARANKREPADA